MSRLALVAGASAVLGAAGGAAAGYLIARKILDTKYQEALEKEIEETKNFYALLNKGDGFATPQEAAETLGVDEELVVGAARAMVNYQGKPSTPIVGSNLVNVFKRDPGYDDEPTPEELAARGDKAPYIISNMEYDSNESEFDQQVLTWYVNDATLCDEYDEIVDDADMVVGNDNLQKFGMRSKDANVVYVRNEKLRIEYHILRSTESYAEVIGLGKQP